jgi:hypothetical protein
MRSKGHAHSEVDVSTVARVEALCEETLTCAGLEGDDDPNARIGHDGMWLSAYWQIAPGERAGVVAALAALADLFTGFVLIAAQPTNLAIGAPLEVHTFGNSMPRRFGPLLDTRRSEAK